MKTISYIPDIKEIADLEKAGYIFHHSAIRRGYNSRKEQTIIAYKGRFGEGVIVKENNPRSTQYGIRINYYIKSK